METRVSLGVKLPTRINTEKIAIKPSSLQFFHNHGEQLLSQLPVSRNLLAKRRRCHGPVIFKVSCSSELSPASTVEPRSIPASFDESMIIKNISEEIEPYLNGRCIYLVGMMGSGKTTVGKVLSEAVGYSFYDCDKLIEETVGASSVAEIFKLYGESFFRENETEVLHKLSSMKRLVVSTGGGAVVRPINWRHMNKGISVWLDVPLEALAQRIVADGTHSRPLICQEPGDPYSKTMKRLSNLFEERGEAYANANVRVSFRNIAAKRGFKDVCNLTPTVIGIEVLLQIENFLKK